MLTLKRRQYLIQSLNVICFLILSGALFSACSSQPIVDLKDIDQVQYERDLVECKEYQKQVKNSAVKKSLGSAIVGALVGAIYGNADRSAGSAAIIGGASGIAQDNNKKDSVLRRCLAQRGYRILA